ncbi:MAG TPA: hypothetical protein PKL49_08255 [Steroidobacteraceae bacterium]|nr:hypothetical protein [Steroidobacteraceae bacterium]
MTVHVVFVHGLFMTGLESLPLRRHLVRELGAAAHTFPYMATLEPIGEVAARLARRLVSLADGDAQALVHVVGHSFGGLIALHALGQGGAPSPDHGALPPGRVVLLGSPVAGSGAAIALAARPVLGRALGRSGAALAAPGLDGARVSGREIGIIAGNRAAGLGRFFAGFDEPNDGTVAVRETTLAGATDRIVLPVSHTGMLLSPRVARETAQFLRHGRFSLTASS